MLDCPWQGQTVLVVDDSATSRALLLALLKGLPVTVEQADSAAQLRCMAQRKEYSLVLLDVRLPDGYGVELLQEVRARLPRATVVLISGKADLLTATDALVRGADGFLDKRHLKEGPQAFRQAVEHAMLHRARVLDQQELRELKEEFLSVIVHDLRGPAASAKVALQMHRESPDEELLNLAERNLDRLFARLDRYLDYRRMEALSWRMEPEPHDLFDLVDEVVAALGPLAQSQERELIWQRPPGQAVLEMDRVWVSQAVENLLSNALKHTPPDCRVQVLSGRDGFQAWIEVHDQGPGVPPELLPHLFERFTQGHPSGRSSGGVGLGLAIVKNVVTAHGGTVRYAQGEGASFFLSLPCQP